MATITKQTGLYAARKSFRAIGTNKAMAWLDQLMAETAGTASGEDALTVLNRKMEEGTIIGHGTNLIPATETAPWIYLRTDEHNFYLKERTGAPGSYTYFWQGPFFIGSYESRIIYSTHVSPSAPVIAWNAANANFNITGGDWALDLVHPKWFRIVLLPRNSNTPQISPLIRVGDPTAEDISYTPPSTTGNLASSVDNLKEVADAFHNATLGGSTTSPPPPTTTPTTEGLFQSEETTSPTYSSNPPALSGVGSTATFNFNIDQDLRDFSSNYNEDIFIEANAKITLQTGFGATGNYTFDIRTGAGNTFTHAIAGAISIERINPAISGYVRVAGNIPRGITSIQLRVTVAPGSNTAIVAGVDNFRAELRPDINADEVLINQGDLGNNITDSSPNTLSSFISQVDELPIQPSDFEDIDWPPAPDGIDDNGSEVTRRIGIHRNIQNFMRRPNHTYIAKVTYKSALIAGSPTDGRTSINFTHNIYVEDAGGTNRRVISGISYTGQTTTAITRNVVIDLPDTTTTIEVSFANQNVQADARLLITDYDLDIVEKVTGADVSIDSSGFNGNLATTDDNAQKVAQKLDDLSISGGGGGGGSTYGQRTTLNNINRAANTIETVDLVSEQITLSSRLVDEGGERLNNPIAITVGYTITLPPALSGNVGTLFIRNVSNSENPGTTYGQQNISGVTSGNTININAILPHSANIPNTFYIILQIAVQPQAYAISLTNGIMYAERDLVGSIPSENITIPEDTMANPVDFIGGLREVTGVSGVPNTPANVQQLAAKADYLFQQAYNPYQKTDNLDRFVVDRTVDTFDVGSTSALSNAIDIPNELRELETPIVIRIRAQVGPNPIGSNFTGTASLRNEANSATIGTPSSDEALSGTTLSVGDYINFERVLSVTEVAANARFRIRFLRTVHNGATAQFSDGFVYMEVSAGSGGGMATAEPEVIWRAGPTTNDRTTAISTSTNHSLISGRRFDQYRGIVIWFDSDGAAGSGIFSYVPEPAISDMITNHGTGGRAGLVILEAFGAYKLIKPINQTTFRIYEGSHNVGIRRIYGIP